MYKQMHTWNNVFPLVVFQGSHVALGVILDFWIPISTSRILWWQAVNTTLAKDLLLNNYTNWQTEK